MGFLLRPAVLSTCIINKLPLTNYVIGSVYSHKKLHKVDRQRLAKDVISRVENSRDPMTQSPHYALIRATIQDDPAPFAMNLGIEIQTTPKKMRTVTQIMTSNGKGSDRPEAT
jgi:hypothetical protein